jgi:hypothetical protein
MADEEERSPVDDLVDLLVYAPVGLLYEYDEVIPRLVRRGKSQVQLARVVGKMAVRSGGSDAFGLVADAVASMLAKRITEIGASIGLAPPAEPDEGTPAPAATAEPPRPADPAPPEPTGPGDAGAADERPLPIASYDTLTAQEIIGLLDELDGGQLARIRAHEEANRARKTVIAKLERLGA